MHIQRVLLVASLALIGATPVAAEGEDVPLAPRLLIPLAITPDVSDAPTGQVGKTRGLVLRPELDEAPLEPLADLKPRLLPVASK